MLSGVLAILLEKNWFMVLDSSSKIPLYAILGLAVTFTLVFALVDVINYTATFFLRPYDSVPVESGYQIMSILLASLVMGSVYGLVFGFMDIEDQKLYNIKDALIHDEYFCYPFGFLIGGLTGLINEYLRQTKPIETVSDNFNDEI